MKLHCLKSFALNLPLLLAACGGGGGAVAIISPSPTASLTPQQQIVALEANGTLPKLDRSLSLAGTDANGNGVRDDIDAYISVSYTKAAERSAATQVAQSLQSEVLIDTSNNQAVKALSLKNSRAINCVFSIFTGKNGSVQPAAVVTNIESMTANTKNRLLKYLAFSKALNGTSMSIPEGNTCD